MAVPDSYMSSVKNLSAILERIKSAGAPPKFTAEFLKSSLGFTSSNDRAILAVLKNLGFLTTDGTPTPRYNEFRADGTGPAVLAEGLREGWADLFLADQKAQERSPSQLKDVFKSLTGKSDAVAEKMATTFKALADQADWSGKAPFANVETASTIRDAEDKRDDEPFSKGLGGGVLKLTHDIHIHLPPTSDVAVYKAIFRALKDELLD